MLQEVIGITFKVYSISTSTRHLGNWFVWSWLSEENSRRQGHMKDIGPDKNWEQISDLVISPEHQTLIFSLGENRNFADFYEGNFSRMDSFMLMRPHFRHFFWATLPNLWEGKKSGGRWQQVCSSTNAVTLPEIQIQANFATFSFAIKKGICKFIPYSWDYVVLSLLRTWDKVATSANVLFSAHPPKSKCAVHFRPEQGFIINMDHP